MVRITLEISAELERKLRDIADEEGKSVEQVAVDLLSLLIPAPGSPRALLQGLRELPRLEPGDVEALEEEIRRSRVPSVDKDVFG